MERTFRIYKLTNSATGLSYVGVTIKTITARFKQHFYHAMRAGARKYFLHSALIKYGCDAFLIEQIAEAYSEREAVVLERAMIAAHNTMAPNGYNLSTGGEGSAGWTASPEMRERMAAAKRGKKWSPQKREKMKVIQSTAEYRAKMRVNNSKRGPVIITDETREKMRAATTRQFSDPAKREAAAQKTRDAFENDPTLAARISASLKGRKMSPERLASHRVMCATPEHKAKMIEACSKRIRRERTPEEKFAFSVKLRTSWEVRRQKQYEKIERVIFDRYNLFAGAP